MTDLRTFADDRRGNVAMIFGLLTPVFVVCAGMAVDTSSVEASKWSMQRSLDAAALGAAKQYGTTPDPAVVEKWASSLFFANEGRDPNDNTKFTYEGVKRVDGNNVLRVSATRDEPTYFGGAIKALTGGNVDLETWHLSQFSEVIVQNRSVELALVLDNSGSMAKAPASGGSTKMTTLRSATEKLVTQMLAPQPTANAKDPVRISIVPFSGAVNVGTKHANASWMDTLGISPMHHDDLDWTQWKLLGIQQAVKGFDGAWRQLGVGPALTRFTLFDRMKARGGASWGWGGCVASRPEGYAVTDDAPDTRRPATLFVPLFMPSEYNWSGSLSSVKNDYIPDTNNAGGNSDLAVLGRQRDVTKYFGNASLNRNAAGPDSLCNTTAITPLTSTQSTAMAAVRAMEPLGGTNIAEGLAWGWRTLTSGEPFTEGRPRNSKENLKVLVLMTDGENTYNAGYASGEQIELTNANRSQFGTYGFGQIVGDDGKLRVGRMFDATKTTTKRAAISNITDAMNETMSIVCENIRKDGTNDDGGDGIVIFTIAFDLKDGSPVKERLRNCASKGIDGKGGRLYYDAKNSNDLLVAFSAITDEISALRIAR